jgi:hypothetical protein
MQVEVDGTRYRIRFAHERHWATEKRAVRRRDGTERLLEVKLPMSFTKPSLVKRNRRTDSYERVPLLALTTCGVYQPQGKTDVGPVEWVLAAQPGEAACALSEPKGFDKEYARQLSLARVLVHLPRRLAGPLLGAYMMSGRRELRDLSGARIVDDARRVIVVPSLKAILQYCREEVPPSPSREEVSL